MGGKDLTPPSSASTSQGKDAQGHLGHRGGEMEGCVSHRHIKQMKVEKDEEGINKERKSEMACS